MESKLSRDVLKLAPDSVLRRRPVVTQPGLPSPILVGLLGRPWSWGWRNGLLFLLDVYIIFGRKRHVWWNGLDTNFPSDL